MVMTGSGLADRLKNILAEAPAGINAAGSRSRLVVVLAVLGGVFGCFVGGHAIGAGDPASQIDGGAALRTERLMARARGLAANRTRLRRRRWVRCVGHGS